MDPVIAKIKAEYGPDVSVQAAVYNVASAFTRKPFLDQTTAEFSVSSEPSVRGAFNFAQATLPLMLNSDGKGYSPTLIFSGATAALKGGSNMAGFATGKFGTRAIAQSIAREFGPKGIHVSHVIIDGLIDTEKTKMYGQNTPDSKIDPEWIAETYWFLHTQPRSSFTHEMDLRPYSETW